MTKASAKKIKDPLAKARGECAHDHKIASCLSAAYHMSIRGDFDYNKFAKVCKFSGLSDGHIALGEPERKAKTIEEIHERFIYRTVVFAHEEDIRWVWDRLRETDYLENPGFLYLVILNDLDISESFFPYVIDLYSGFSQKTLLDYATTLCPSNNAANHSLAPLAPWGYAPKVDSVRRGLVQQIWKGDPFYKLIAADPFFYSTVALNIATLKRLEERGVSEYFIPDAAYLPAFLLSRFDLRDKRIHLPERSEINDQVVSQLYPPASAPDFPVGKIKERFDTTPDSDFRVAIARQSTRFYKGQVLFYEFPFALSENELLEAISSRLCLLQPGAILTFSIRHEHPSNVFWLDILSHDEPRNRLFVGASIDKHGKLTTADDVVARAIHKAAPLTCTLETIESRDSDENLIATQYIITCNQQYA